MFKIRDIPSAIVAHSGNNLRGEEFKGQYTKGSILSTLKNLLLKRPPEVNTVAELDELRSQFHEHLIFGVFESEDCELFQPFKKAAMNYNDLSFAMSFNLSL